MYCRAVCSHANRIIVSRLFTAFVLFIFLFLLGIAPAVAADDQRPASGFLNTAPVITNFTKTGTRGKPFVFADKDFLNAYSDSESDPLASIKVVTLPTNGSLIIDGAPVTVNQEIPAVQLGKLTFVPPTGWFGTTSFSWSASDGQSYSTAAVASIFYPYSPLYTYLPVIMKPLPPPSAFNKVSPAYGTSVQPANLPLDWQDSANASGYYYCIDANINNACDGTWTSTGMVSQALLPGLNYGTSYEWQVFATNTSGVTYSNGSPSAFYRFITVPPPTWYTAFSENFEGAFPGAWQLYSEWYYQGYYYDVTSDVSWAKRNCRVFSGSYGGWAVGGGSIGGSVSCQGSYPNDILTLMVYGPFDLSQVKDGWMSIKIWSDTEMEYDYLVWGVSVNNENFYGRYYTGYSRGWITDTIDLKNVYGLGNVTGASQVWIGVWFESDSTNLYFEEGVAVDNLVLSTCSSASGCAGSPALSAVQEFPATLKVDNFAGMLRKQGLQPSSTAPDHVQDMLQSRWSEKEILK